MATFLKISLSFYLSFVLHLHKLQHYGLSFEDAETINVFLVLSFLIAAKG